MNVPRLFENEARIAELGVGIAFGTILQIVKIAIILTVLFLTWPVFGEQFGVSRRASSNPPSPPQYYAAPTLAPLSGVAAVPTKPLPKNGSQVVPAAPNGPAVESASPMPNVVRLIAFDQSGQSFGSGSYIGNFDEYGLVLSNWHVVCETDGLVHIHFPCGFSSFGAMVLSDNKWDLAMIVVSKPPSSVPPLPIARTMPKPGDPLWIAGHGSGSYRQAGGRCVRYLAPEIPKNGTAPLYEIIDLSVHARQGDSGGPILNRNGELAGVLFGSDMVKNTAGSCCERVNRFLHQARPLLEKLPRRPEVHFAQTEPQGPRHQLIDSLSNPARTRETFSVPNEAGLESSPPTSFQIPDHFVPPQSGVAGTRTASWTEPSFLGKKTFTLMGSIGPRFQTSPQSQDVPITEEYHEIDLLEHELVPGIPNAFDAELVSLNPSARNEQEGNSWLPTLQGIQSSGNAVAFDKYGRLDDAAEDAAEMDAPQAKENDSDNSVRADTVLPLPPAILVAGVVLVLLCFFLVRHL